MFGETKIMFEPFGSNETYFIVVRTISLPSYGSPRNAGTWLGAQSLEQEGGGAEGPPPEKVDYRIADGTRKGYPGNETPPKGKSEEPGNP